MKDLITIALPVYKRTDFVRSALDSAVKQTQECSILLIDNNSPHDDFKKIVDSYENANIKYIKTKETVPQDENFNNCFRYADTPWVSILHDDDMLHCQYVEFSAKILKQYGEKAGGIGYTSFVAEEEWDEIYTQKELSDDIKGMNPAFFYFHHFAFPGVLLNKDVAMNIGGFKNGLFPIADFDFWYRYSKEMPMIYVNQDMSFYRISPSQSTNQVIDAMINNIYNYRLKIIEEGKHNNYLCKLGLEYTRLMNIKYFLETYDSVEMPKLSNEKHFRKAERILKFRIPNKVVRMYMDRIAFTNL
jgi:glycosyltransferase involved in cell wall biosynthesis